MNLQSIQTWLKKMWSGPNRKQTLVLLALVMVTLFFLGSTFLSSEGGDETIPTTVVKRGPVTIKITESGELRAQDQITISAVTDKQILWLASEGAWVQEGDTLIVYESEKYIISKGDAESGLLVAKADLVRAQSDCRYEEGNDCIECLSGCRADSKQSMLITTLKRALENGLTLQSR
ncbi:MAG: hypothetical protein AAB354_11500, partial [candidate division KSB1 bacterium]